LAALTAPRIASRLTLVWIGGPKYPSLALPLSHATTLEYNLGIDPAAARAVFNRTQLALWQVPRNAYRQVLPYAQLLTQVKPRGKLGRYLATTLESLMVRLPQYHLNIGETYIFGDSPLVLLTALQASFEADPSSSDYALRLAPHLNAQGTYENPAGRPMRVYHRLDTALLLNNFFAKLELFGM
jgi:purine nucleosidase